MPYNIARTHQTNNVGECEYAISPSMTFSVITSCLAVAGRQPNGDIVGVHLVMIDGHGNFFDNNAANQAGGLLGLCQQHVIIGPIGFWQDPANGPIAAAFQVLDGLYNFRHVDITGAPRLRLWSRFGRMRYRTGNGCCACLGF